MILIPFITVVLFFMKDKESVKFNKGNIRFNENLPADKLSFTKNVSYWLIKKAPGYSRGTSMMILLSDHYMVMLSFSKRPCVLNTSSFFLRSFFATLMWYLVLCPGK